MNLSTLILVCFAVKDESRFFKPVAAADPRLECVVTGIGQRNAEQAFRQALSRQRPALVLSCGFAGGLRPDLGQGTVVYALHGTTELEPALQRAGAQPVNFHCSERIVTTADEKRALRAATGADAVEMESQIICGICREQNIPSAIVRVISDTANDDLPLDFNQLMTGDQQISSRKLALALMRSPSKLGALLRFQQQSEAAAKKLTDVLKQLLVSPGLARAAGTVRGLTAT